jgi:hypothetical protein
MQYLLILLLFIVSCNRNEIPKDVLPPEKMGAVLYDIVLADELTDFASITDSTYRKFPKRTGLYDTVLQIHKISKQQYKKSEQFYQSRPDLMKEIFENLKKKMDTPVKKSLKPL